MQSPLGRTLTPAAPLAPKDKLSLTAGLIRAPPSAICDLAASLVGAPHMPAASLWSWIFFCARSSSYLRLSSADSRSAARTAMKMIIHYENAKHHEDVQQGVEDRIDSGVNAEICTGNGAETPGGSENGLVADHAGCS